MYAVSEFDVILPCYRFIPTQPGSFYRPKSISLDNNESWQVASIILIGYLKIKVLNLFKLSQGMFKVPSISLNEPKFDKKSL